MYEYEGFLYTLEQVQGYADKFGTSLEDFISKKGIKKIEEKKEVEEAVGFDLLNPDFQEDTVESAGAVSEETPAQEDTVSVSEDTSSELIGPKIPSSDIEELEMKSRGEIPSNSYYIDKGMKGKVDFIPGEKGRKYSQFYIPGKEGRAKDSDFKTSEIKPWDRLSFSEKNEMKYNMKDLDIEFPYLYDSSNSDVFVSRNYTSKDLEKLNINTKDFEGFLTRKGFKEDFIEKEQGDYWNETLSDNPFNKVRSVRSDNQRKKDLEKQRVLKKYLELYIKDQDSRLNDRKRLEYIKENPDNLTEKELVNLKPSRVRYTKFNQKNIQDFLKNEYPLAAEVDNKNYKEKVDYVNKLESMSGAEALLNGGAKFVTGAGGGFKRSFSDTAATIFDVLGLDQSAAEIRAQQEEDRLSNENDIVYVSVEGKKYKDKKGVEYILDENNQIYNITKGYNVAYTMSPFEQKQLYKKLKNSNEYGSDWNAQGVAATTGDVFGGIAFQVGGAYVTGLATAGLSLRAAAYANGFKNASEYKKVLDRYIAINGKAPNTLRIPIKKQLVDNAIFQSSYGYSIGYENILSESNKAGLSPSLARELASNGAGKMAVLFGVTSFLNPRTKIQENIFGGKIRAAAEKAVKEATKLGKKGFDKSISNTIRDLSKKASKKGVEVTEEGVKEVFQENVQQAGEFNLVNESINKKVGFDLLKDTYTLRDIKNTSALSFLAAGGMANVKKPSFKSDPLSNIKTLNILGNNLKEVSTIYDEMVENSVITRNQANELIKDAEAVVSQYQKVSANILKTDKGLTILRKLKELDDLKKNKDKLAEPFKLKEEAKIESINNDISKLIDESIEIEDARKEAKKIVGEDFKGEVGDGDVILAFDNADLANQAMSEAFDKGAINKKFFEEAKMDNKTIGTELPNGQIIINREAALRFNEGTNVAFHEILHKVLRSKFNNTEDGKKYLDNFLNALSSSEKSKLEKRIKIYKDKPGYLENNPDEYLTQFFEMLRDEEVSSIEGTLKSIWNSIKRVFSDSGFKQLDFNEGQDIYEFIKDYSKNTKRSKKIGDKAVELGREGLENKSTKAPKSLASLQEQLENLDEFDFDFDVFAFEAAKTNLKKKIELAKKKEAEPKKETKERPKKKVNEKLIGDQFKEMVPEKTTNAEYKSKIAPKVIRKIEDDRMLFPLVKKIAAGYNIVADNVYGKSWDDFYDAVIGVQLKKNILNFKPETNDDLGGYIVGGQAGVRNRVKEALEKFKKEESKATEDISQAADLTTEDKTSKQESRKKYTSIINSNVVPSFTTKAITEKLTGIINSLKSRITDKAGNNAASTPLIKEIKSKVGKVVGDKTAIPKLIRERMGKFTKDQKTYEQFLIKNKKAILENMTTTWLMTAIPNAVEKSVGGRYTGEFDIVNIAGQEAKYEVFKPNYVPYSEWKGAKIDREGGAKRGITSGNELTRRVPANRISDQDFVDALIVKGDNKKTQSKFESLSKALAEELSFEIISRELKNPNSGITQAFKENQNALGVMLVDNFVEEYNRQSERGLVKFSVSMRTGINKIDGARSGLNTLLRIKYPEYTPLNPLTFDEIEKIVEKDIDLKLMYLDLKKAHEEYISRAIGEDKGLTERQQEDFEKFKKGGNDVFSSWINTSLQYSYFNINNVLGTNPVYTNRFKIADTTRRKSEIFLEKYIKDLIKLNSKTAAEEFIRTVQAPLASGKGQSLFGNNEGIFSFIKNKMKKDTSIDKAFKNVGLVKSGRGKTFTIDGKKVTTELDYTTQAIDLLELFDGKNKKVSDLKFIEKRKEESKRSAKRFIKFIEYLRKEKVDKDVVGLMLNSMAGSMRSIAKMSSEIKGAFIVEDLKPKDYTYEHGIPTKQLLIASASYIVSGEKVTKDVLKDIVNKGSIYIIPTKIAKAIDAFYRSTFSNNKALTESDPEVYRYFEVSDNFKNYLESQGILDFNQNNTTYFSSDKDNVKINTKFSKSNIELNKVQKGQKAIDNAVKYSYAQNPKGISVWDFDDTLARTKSNVLYTMPDGTKGKLNAAQFAAKSEELADQGAKFDFSEFSKVMKGEKGPMFDKAINRNKKFGNKNVYILTARPADSKYAIHDFLKGIGLDVRLENIVGLADGNPQAKANWMIGKVSEGYNDFYFADDHLSNVKAVKEVLDNFDVKGKVQQAKVKFSMSLDKDFNDMIERNKGISSTKEFSPVVAKRMAKNKGMFKFWMPASLDDFRGLTQYVFAGKGKQGQADQKFFQDALITPYFRGIKAIEDSRQTFKEDFKALNRAYKPVLKKLGKLIPNGDYTYDQAIRVALWKKSGYDIPGLSKKDEKNLVDFIDSQADLTEYVLLLQRISKRPKWAKPEAFWDSQTILSDLNNMTEKGGRKEYISEFIENVDIIFSEKNLLKIKALYGEAQVSALKDIIWRMKNGTNRTSGMNKNVNRFNNWVNNSIGAIMFFNRRSALLQTLSTVNFINWSDNNIIKAGAAFANQPRFWKDFAMIFNSAKLKQRRSGLKSDVNEAEIASAVKGSKNKATAALSYLLKKGFLPTQMVDSFAIASGGATFYRNRVNTYLKQGMELAAAEKQAFEDFSQISEETQQSGDPALISSDQASALGRLLLAFQNTPIQLNRSIKKAALDIKNRRRSPGQTMVQSDFSNLSKIIYYGAIQNIIFSALQNALFAVIPGFGDDDDELTEEEQKEKYGKVVSTKHGRIINGISDTLLKGGFGVPGAFISTAKNMYMEYNKQEKKEFLADHTYTILAGANLAPPVGSKLRKIYSAIQTNRFEKDVIKERGWDVTIDGRFNLSPSYRVLGSFTEGATNLPLDRVVSEVNAITEALDSRNTTWQRLALAMGWKTWDVSAKNEEHDLIKTKAKAVRKKEGIEKSKKTRNENNKKIKQLFNKLSLGDKSRYKRKKGDLSVKEKIKYLEKLNNDRIKRIKDKNE